MVVVQIGLGVSAAINKKSDKEISEELKQSMMDYDNHMEYWDDVQTKVQLFK